MTRDAGAIDDRRERRNFHLRAAAVVAFALALRLLYVSMAQVEYPIRGDINQYVLYAWNLEHRHVFSMALPQQAPTPDSYRGPGYPAFLALTMALAGHSDLPLREGRDGHAVLGYRGDTWMSLALLAQVLLGALTVWLTMRIARMCVSENWALAAGVLVAFWPHLITFTGVLLSETLFACFLLVALLALCRAVETASRAHLAIAGLLWGACYLVNPVVALFPCVVGGMLARRLRSGAVVLVAVFVLVAGAWGLRNAVVGAHSGALQRAEENFVQGSWPQFHRAFNSRFDNEISRRIVDAIDEEANTLQASPRAGLARMRERLGEDPLYYLWWYVARKPYLLWDWSIRIGIGGIYYLPTEHSPFERIPILKAVSSIFERINPCLFAIAGTTALLTLGGWLRRRSMPLPLLLIAALAVYLTAVHVALQAEPRYSIPYRPLEVLLAIAGSAWLYRRARSWRMRASAGRAGPAVDAEGTIDTRPRRPEP